ncbi:MAG: 50S ribosomal protein L29 [Parachlamydiales bacterium]|nr:50S ribosomal protein L29 [Parachlamydiales bacterium]
MKKLQEIRELSDQQLSNKLDDLDKEIFALRNALATAHKLEQPHLIREKKKTKARILTILTQRAKEGGVRHEK